ncbi:restriction endonuclease subunit S [Sphingomicrobium sp. XHP0235]|uniref:restriction endonuclease subunit S n=1 Tax=Sphingomicrobium aquimarinum TaxID=3133971 RepID=UPI0031FEDFC4
MHERVTVHKAGWPRVAFGDVVRKVSDKVDPWESGLERYVAGEHMDTDDLRIRRWGLIGDDYLGPAFHMHFRPGQVLYGSRRTYLRKVAVADFEGITANTTFVLESKDPTQLMPELLPFLMRTEEFHEYSIEHSKGSVNPYINFSDLEAFEFVLPPIQEQARLVGTLRAVEDAAEAMLQASETARKLFLSLLDEMIEQLSDARPLAISAACADGAPLCYGVVQPGDNVANGVPLIRVCDIETDQINRTELKRISPKIHNEYKRSQIAAGDVLVSIVGTIGRIYIATKEDDGSNIARAVARIRTNNQVSPSFLGYVLKAPAYQETLINEAFESARKTLNLNALGALEVPVPAMLEQEHWCRKLAQIERERQNIEDRYQMLKAFVTKVLSEEIAGE